MFVVLNLGGLLTWVERKQSAIMQDRIGRQPRFDPVGLPRCSGAAPSAGRRGQDAHQGRLHARARRPAARSGSPRSCRSSSRLAGFATIPFGDTLQIGGREIQLQAVDAQRRASSTCFAHALAGRLRASMMAGWASANNYALLGGQRAAALMISAEVAIGASIMGVVMVYGSLNMQDIARGQGSRCCRSSRQLDPGVGHPHPAARLRPVPDRRHRRHQADALRHPGGRVGDHRLLRGVQRDEVRHVPDGRLPGDGGRSPGMTTALFLGGWQVPFSPRRSGFHFPGGADRGAAAPGRGGAAGRGLRHQGRAS